MINNKSQGLSNRELINVLEKHVINSGGLAIKTGSSAVVKTASDVHYMIDGNLVLLSATDMAALSGTIAQNSYNVWVFSVDSDGNLAATFGIEATTLAGVEFPAIEEDEAIIGFVLIKAVGGDFVGGTTALDAGSHEETYHDTPFPVAFN